MARIACLLAFTTALIACSNRAPDALEQWLEHYETARSCVLSDPSVGPDAATVATVSELSGLDRCDVELAQVQWVSVVPGDSNLVNRWRSAVAVFHTTIDRHNSPREFGAAIDRLDPIVTELRHELGLTVAPRGFGTELPMLPPGRTLTIAGQPLATPQGAWGLDPRLEFSGGAVVGHLKGSTTVDFVAETLDDVHVWEHPAWTVLGFPSGTWYAGDGKLETTKLSVMRNQISLPEEVSLVGALDSGETRMVVLEPTSTCSDHSYSVVVSMDSGSHWHVVAVPGTGRILNVAQSPRTGKIDLILASSDLVYLQRIEPNSPLWSALTATPATSFPRGPGAAEKRPLAHRVDCRADAVWSVDGHHVHRVDGDGFATFTRETSLSPRLDCRAGDALILGQSPTVGRSNVVERCTAGGCRVVLRPAHNLESAIAMLDDGSWIYASAHDGIVGVWHEAFAEPNFYRLGSRGTLHAITVLRGVPHLVIVGADGVYRFVPLSI